MELHVKLLSDSATAPTVSHPGDDLAWDLFASQETTIPSGCLVKVKTDIAAQFINTKTDLIKSKYGLLVRDRSGLASKMLAVSGGVIDASYTGEIMVLITNHGPDPYHFHVGDRIAQMFPIPILTNSPIKVVTEFENISRGDKGFGSSGR